MTKTIRLAIRLAIWFAASVLAILAAVDMHHDRQEAACRVPYGRVKP